MASELGKITLVSWKFQEESPSVKLNTKEQFKNYAKGAHIFLYLII